MAHLLNTVLFNTSARKRARQGIAVLGFGLFAATISFSATAAEASETLGALTDAQLTNLAADWQQLDASARADLIAETRERMQPSDELTQQASPPSTSHSTAAQPTAANGATPRGGLPPANAGAVPHTQAPAQITVRAQRRRYGRIVRKADGSLVRIETQVVTVQRRDPKRAFGVGFERRQRQHGQQPVTTASTVRESNGVTVVGRPPELAPPAAQVRVPGVIAVTKTLD